MDAPAVIEAILDRGLSSGTHKFVVLAALLDTIIECPEQDPKGGMHRVPVMDLARRVLALLWRPVVRGVSQSSGKGSDGGELNGIIRDLRESAPVWPTADDATPKPIAWSGDTAGTHLFHELPSGAPAPPAIRNALTGVWRNILRYPLKHVPMVEGRRLDLYHVATLLDEETSGAFFERTADDNTAPALR